MKIRSHSLVRAFVHCFGIAQQDTLETVIIRLGYYLFQREI